MRENCTHNTLSETTTLSSRICTESKDSHTLETWKNLFWVMNFRSNKTPTCLSNHQKKLECLWFQLLAALIVLWDQKMVPLCKSCTIWFKKSSETRLAATILRRLESNQKIERSWQKYWACLEDDLRAVSLRWMNKKSKKRHRNLPRVTQKMENRLANLHFQGIWPLWTILERKADKEAVKGIVLWVLAAENSWEELSHRVKIHQSRL